MWQLGFILATLGLVMGTTAGLLRGLDALGRYLQGEPRGGTRYGSVEEVERRLGARLLLPAYFPETLEWPPATIRLLAGPPPSVVLSFAGRKGSGQRLVIYYQISGGAGPILPEPLPPGQVLHTTTVSLQGSEGELSRIASEDGEIWHALSWEKEGRRIALRFKGPLGELLKMARSMGRQGP